jgi:UDP-3-O-[3-hydroxymyristoyl] N-acetylglucosamine deacetylase
MGYDGALRSHEARRPVSFVPQQTIGRSVGTMGIGLHGGVPATVTLLPGEPDTGVVFRRADLGRESPAIPARHTHVVASRLRTVLGNGPASVATVEHLLAAFSGLGIDNAVVVVDGPEVPALDGSALPFVELVDRAGRVAQDAPRRLLRVLRAVEARSAQGSVRLGPGPGLAIDMELGHPGTPIARQRATLALTPATFRTEIAPARTYGFLDDVEALRAEGLARGGSLDNAVVVARESIVDAARLRFPDEPVRHKILDALGDLFLAGAPIEGRFVGRGSGHALNHAVLAALFADPSAWRLEPMLAAAATRIATGGLGVPAGG